MVEVIAERRDSFVGAIRDSDDPSMLDDHRLLDGSFEMDLKYSAFSNAYEHAKDVEQNGGTGLTPSAQAMDVVEAANPALEIASAIVGSAVHAFPLAGGVYKEGKDNIEGIVSFVKQIPGGAKKAARRVVRAGKKVERVFTRDHEEPELEPESADPPLSARPEEEGPAPTGAA
jgi:hypothetical protein